MIEIVTGTPSPLAATGIVWDIFGAVALAKGLIVDDDTLRRRSGTYFDLSPPAVRGLCEQRNDARFGLWQLGVGFSLQLLAAIGVQLSWYLAAGLLVPLLLAWFVYWRRAKWLVLKASLLFSTPDATEDVWRVHFTDIPEAHWKKAITESGLAFKPPPKSP
jgi:hypothetical protein